MVGAEQPVRVSGERFELMSDVTGRIEAHGLTTRMKVAREVALAWLDRNRDVTITANDLSKTLQEMVTELFRPEATAGTEHANAVLQAADVDGKVFASARALPKNADMTVEHGALIARVCVVLAPLAGAVRMARIPVTNAATTMLNVAPSEQANARRRLRDLVVARVKPFAYVIHDVVGNDETAEEYLRLIMTSREALAAEIVAAAEGTTARAKALDNDGREQLTKCMTRHGTLLRRAAAKRYGADADDILGDVGVKLSVAFRNNSKLDVGEGYVLVALGNAARTHYLSLNARRAHETGLPEDVDALGSGRDETARLEVVDLIVRHVLAAVHTLDPVDAEAQLARQTLMTGFLANPAEVDPRKARLADHALGMIGDDHGVRKGLSAIALVLAPNKAAASRIATRAVGALRSLAAAGA